MRLRPIREQKFCMKTNNIAYNRLIKKKKKKKKKKHILEN